MAHNIQMTVTSLRLWRAFFGNNNRKMNSVLLSFIYITYVACAAAVPQSKPFNVATNRPTFASSVNSDQNISAIY